MSDHKHTAACCCDDISMENIRLASLLDSMTRENEQLKRDNAALIDLREIADGKVMSLEHHQGFLWG